MTHRGPFQPLLFCDSVIIFCSVVVRLFDFRLNKRLNFLLLVIYYCTFHPLLPCLFPCRYMHFIGFGVKERGGVCSFFFFSPFLFLQWFCIATFECSKPHAEGSCSKEFSYKFCLFYAF